MREDGGGGGGEGGGWGDEEMKMEKRKFIEGKEGREKKYEKGRK